VENKAIVKIEIRKFYLDFPVFIAKIEDDCILGVDFLERVKLGGIFTSVFKGILESSCFTDQTIIFGYIISSY